MNFDRTDNVILTLAAGLIVAGAIGLSWSPSIAQTPVQYGPPPYGGPPMWDRRMPPPYEEDRRWPPTRLGPQMEPCIRYGECRGPRYEDDPEESWRRPRGRERWS